MKDWITDVCDNYCFLVEYVGDSDEVVIPSVLDGRETVLCGNAFTKVGRTLKLKTSGEVMVTDCHSLFPRCELPNGPVETKKKLHFVRGSNAAFLVGFTGNGTLKISGRELDIPLVVSDAMFDGSEKIYSLVVSNWVYVLGGDFSDLHNVLC